MSETKRPITVVAAGILLDSEGRYLLGQRPVGKPYAGYWEVPGGKVEKGETVFQALQRELQEELGIQIQSSFQKQPTFLKSFQKRLVHSDILQLIFH